MDYRYLLPSESKSKIFFSIDDDIHTDCEELKKSFKVWQSYAVGDIGPLLSYAVRSFDFVARSGTFKSSDFTEKGEFYSLVLIG